jgi:hypothetical protein
MKTVMVRYQVRPDAAAENERLVRAVFAQLERDKPQGLSYRVLRLADGVSFVHVASYDGEGANPLTQLEAFKEFQAGSKDRRVEQPVVTDATPIGAYP